jgi:SPP1 gp7 family putative phage head morphogenesis protein
LTRKWYEYGDALYAEIRTVIRREFRRSRLTLPFDEINQGNVTIAKWRIQRLYRRLRKINRDCFEDIIEEVYAAALLEAGAKKSNKKLPRSWLDKFLLSYNPVTKYVYDHEIERKESRLYEAVVADALSGNRHGLEVDYKNAERYWTTMTAQYCIDIEDAVALQAYEDAKAEKVMWVSERDNRVCDECQRRNGMIFAVDRVPAKPHYACRCHTVPVWD